MYAGGDTKKGFGALACTGAAARTAALLPSALNGRVLAVCAVTISVRKNSRPSLAAAPSVSAPYTWLCCQAIKDNVLFTK